MMKMNRSELWKNFRLGEELDISGTFIYNGLRRFHELQVLDHSAELFEIFYQLSIGLERLMKIAIVMLEHDETKNQKEFEKSLITHDHQKLIQRICIHVDMSINPQESTFLHFLSDFYKDLRYDRFSLTSPLVLDKEKVKLFKYLEHHLNVHFGECKTPFGHSNTDQFRKFIRKVVIKISGNLYGVIAKCATEMNLYTYELRSGSKAETVFLGEANIPDEDILLKELLLFFMNTHETSGYLAFLRSIKPLDFDPALISDYLDCFRSESARAQIVEELETLYEDIDHRERLQLLKTIGSPDAFFDDDDEPEEN